MEEIVLYDAQIWNGYRRDIPWILHIKMKYRIRYKYVDYVFNTFKYPSNVDCLSNVDFYAMVHPR